MTTFETAQGFREIDGFRLNITSRYDFALCDYEVTKHLVESTVKLWLYVAKMIKAGERKTTVAVSPEDKATGANGAQLQLTPLAEARVTVWGDVLPGEGFTVHSHTKPQDALDNYWARFDALQGFLSVESTPNVSTQAKAPETPKTPASATENHAPVNDQGIVKITGKKAAGTLSNGTVFEMPIYQVKLRSKDDAQYYEVYTKYGSNLGQYPEMMIYTDNETAKSNGVLDYLGAFGLTPGKEKIGEWVLRGVVKDKGDKKNLYPMSIREAA